MFFLVQYSFVAPSGQRQLLPFSFYVWVFDSSLIWPYSSVCICARNSMFKKWKTVLKCNTQQKCLTQIKYVQRNVWLEKGYRQQIQITRVQVVYSDGKILHIHSASKCSSGFCSFPLKRGAVRAPKRDESLLVFQGVSVISTPWTGEWESEKSKYFTTHVNSPLFKVQRVLLLDKMTYVIY